MISKTFRFSLLFLIILTVKTTAQTHTIEVHSNERVASLLMTPTEYSDWKTNDEFGDKTIREALFKDVYEKFSDVFDFIFLILNETSKPAGLAYGELIQVSNDITGIGMSSFDNTSDYGSSGKLKAVMQLSRIDFLSMGPSLHELMHNWGNFGITTASVSSFGSNLSSYNYSPHWGFTGGNTKGQLGGFKQSTLVENVDGSYTVESFGRFANNGNTVKYSEFELYLMGMIPLSSVTQFDVFTQITSFTNNGNDTYSFEADTRTTHTPASLETLLGSRNPDTTTAQKNFKTLVLVITDTTLTTEQWSSIDTSAEIFSRTSSAGSFTYNFWEATGGRGTLEMNNLQDNLLSSKTINIDRNSIYYDSDKRKIVIDNINTKNIQIFNSYGQQVNYTSQRKALNTSEIDMNNYSAGVYFVSVKNQQETIAKKILIH